MVFKKTFDIIVYETENFVVQQDWEVPIIGFFVLAPKRKVKSITEVLSYSAITTKLQRKPFISITTCF